MSIRETVERIRVLEHEAENLRNGLEKKVLGLAENYRRIFHLFPSYYESYITNKKGFKGYNIYWGFWSHEFKNTFDDSNQRSIFEELPDYLELTIDELEEPKKTIDKWIQLKKELLKKKNMKNRINEFRNC